MREFRVSLKATTWQFVFTGEHSSWVDTCGAGNFPESSQLLT